MQKHIIFIQCFVFQLKNTQIKSLQKHNISAIKLAFQNNIVLSGATIDVCLAAAVAFDSENHQTANARFDLWPNVL